MPKYCVEFIADVCTLPSRDTSDCSDCKTENISLENNSFTLPIKTDSILTYHISSGSNINKQKPKDSNLEHLTKDLNKGSSSLFYSEEDILAKNATSSKYNKNSHELSMGNTVCCMPDNLKSTCEYHCQKPNFDRHLTRDQKYISNCRKFVISRAVQYEEQLQLQTRKEITMFNNHSYQEILCNHHHHHQYIGNNIHERHDHKKNLKRVDKSSQYHLDRKNKISTNQLPKSGINNDDDDDERAFLPCVDILTNQSNNLLNSISEWSVDVSSLSGQRCSSVTPPIRRKIEASLKCERISDSDCYKKAEYISNEENHEIVKDYDTGSLSATFPSKSINPLTYELDYEDEAKCQPSVDNNHNNYNHTKDFDQYKGLKSSSGDLSHLEEQRQENKDGIPYTNLHVPLTDVSAFGDSLHPLTSSTISNNNNQKCLINSSSQKINHQTNGSKQQYHPSESYYIPGPQVEISSQLDLSDGSFTNASSVSSLEQINLNNDQEIIKSTSSHIQQSLNTNQDSVSSLDKHLNERESEESPSGEQKLNEFDKSLKPSINSSKTSNATPTNSITVKISQKPIDSKSNSRQFTKVENTPRQNLPINFKNTLPITSPHNNPTTNQSNHSPRKPTSSPDTNNTQAILPNSHSLRESRIPLPKTTISSPIYRPPSVHKMELLNTDHLKTNQSISPTDIQTETPSQSVIQKTLPSDNKTDSNLPESKLSNQTSANIDNLIEMKVDTNEELENIKVNLQKRQSRSLEKVTYSRDNSIIQSKKSHHFRIRRKRQSHSLQSRYFRRNYYKSNSNNNDDVDDSDFKSHTQITHSRHKSKFYTTKSLTPPTPNPSDKHYNVTENEYTKPFDYNDLKPSQLLLLQVNSTSTINYSDTSNDLKAQLVMNQNNRSLMSSPPINLPVIHKRLSNESISSVALQKLSSRPSTALKEPTVNLSFTAVNPSQIVTPPTSIPSRVKLIRRKFFIPESANIEEILADPDDRRIKAICERYKCDLEIYSKLPWCGFLQYVIIMSARDIYTLKRCARTLDCRLNWCLSAQLK